MDKKDLITNLIRKIFKMHQLGPQIFKHSNLISNLKKKTNLAPFV